MTSPRKQGAVINNYSNFVLGLAVDASVARSWQGYDHPRYEEITNALFEKGEAQIELDGVSGVLIEIGGCGMSDVFRLDGDDIVLLEHYSDDWNPDIEREFLAIVASPLREDAARVGALEVTSGVLALLHAGDAAGEIADSVKAGESEDVEGGVLLGVPNGTYEIWKETLEAEGGWGTIASRIRIVRDVARARAPKEETTVPKAREVVSAARVYPLPEGMGYVASLELSSDGAWLVAGEKSGPTIAVWSTAAGLAWSKALAPRAESHEYTQNVQISLHGSLVAAGVRDKLFVLDRESGRVLAEHGLGPGQTPFAKMIQSSSSFVRFTADGERVLVGQLPSVRVLDWKTGREQAVIEDCSSVFDALLSPDRSLIALPGYVLQLCDARTLAVTRRVELEGYATAGAFSPDGKTIAVASSGVVNFFDVASGAKTGTLPGPSSVRSVDVQEIAWSQHIATASEDGYVRIWNTTHEVIMELPGHDTTIPGTGARNLHGLVFSPDGRTLYVGGAPAGTHAVTAYAIDR